VRYDLIVAGLGAWGSAALYHAARRGLQVLGLDRGAPPHAASGHRGRGRVIRMASPESPVYTPMMQRAYALWHAREEECGQRLIEELGGLYIGTPGSEIVEGSLASFHGTTLDHALLGASAVRAQFPQLGIAAHEQAVWEPGAGVIRPDLAIQAHLEGAKRSGAKVRTGEELQGIEAAGEDIAAATSRGRFVARRMLCCLGAWTPGRLGLAVPLRPERQIVAIYDARGLGKLPIFVAPAAEAEVVYGLPEPEDTYKVALHHGGKSGEPDRLLAAPTAAEATLIEDYAAHRLPALAGHRREAYACLYSNSPDRHFVIGTHPRHPQVIYASGDSGRGFKFASVLGEILARLGAGEMVPDLELFDPARFQASGAKA
jgi:sarcosine oxidase